MPHIVNFTYLLAVAQCNAMLEFMHLDCHGKCQCQCQLYIYRECWSHNAHKCNSRQSVSTSLSLWQIKGIADSFLLQQRFSTFLKFRPNTFLHTFAAVEHRRFNQRHTGISRRMPLSNINAQDWQMHLSRVRNISWFSLGSWRRLDLSL